MEDRHIAARSLRGVVDRVVMRTAPAEEARGTDYINSVRNNTRDPVMAMVATSLAHCADVVVQRLETNWISTSVLDQAQAQVQQASQYPPFTYADPEKAIKVNHKGETLTMAKIRIKKQLDMVNKSLVNCEKARSQKWSKLMKAKAEAAGGGGAGSGGGGGQQSQASSSTSSRQQQQQQRHKSRNTGVSGSAASFAQLQRQRQQQAAQQQQQQQQQKKQQQILQQQQQRQYAAAKAQQQIASMQNSGITAQQQQQQQQYNPMAAGNVAATAAMMAAAGRGGPAALDRKYSIEGVKARTTNDGSVMPVNQPKMLKNGLFMRPAGRQRKGMDWDSRNGVWVPQGTLPPGSLGR
eukprot:860813_1